MLKQEGNISKKDLKLFKVVDTANEAMKYILENLTKNRNSENSEKSIKSETIRKNIKIRKITK